MASIACERADVAEPGQGDGTSCAIGIDRPAQAAALKDKPLGHIPIRSIQRRRDDLSKLDSIVFYIIRGSDTLYGHMRLAARTTP